MDIKYFNYYAVSSTNDVALEQLLKVKDTNTAVVVTAKIQKKGRGRNHKIWFNGADNLYYTFGMKHNAEKYSLCLMQVIGGLATYILLSEILGENVVRLKYPNDVYILDKDKNYKKISGIISEHILINNELCTTIIGIGINNKQADFPEGLQAISLYNLNKNIENDILKEQLTNNITSLLELDKESIASLWKKILRLDNKQIKIIDNTNNQEMEIYFKFESILSDCRLLVMDEKGNPRIIDNGDSIRYDLE